jgi:hypothetical protein
VSKRATYPQISENYGQRAVNVWPQWAFAHRHFEDRNLHVRLRGGDEFPFFLLAKDF